MKAIQRQHNIKRTVRKGQRPYIPLPEGHIFQVQTFRLFLRLPHHVRRVIEAGNIRLGQRLVKRHGQNAGPHRHLQQLTREVFRNTFQCPFQIDIVFRLVHVPHQTAHRFPAQGGAGDHAVIKIVAACQPIGTANRFFSLHRGSSSSFRITIALLMPDGSPLHPISVP